MVEATYVGDPMPSKTTEELQTDRERLTTKVDIRQAEVDGYMRKAQFAENTLDILNSQCSALDTYIEQFGDTEIHEPNSQSEMMTRYFRKCLDIQIEATENYRNEQQSLAVHSQNALWDLESDITSIETALRLRGAA